MPLTTLILEDETPAAQRLQDQLKRLRPEVQMVGVLSGVQEAIDWFATHPKPDLVFSDIELLDGNVFALYERVAVNCPIIFTTAYDQFLLKAFQGNGIAYLLKPFTIEQLEEALNKYELLTQSSPPSVLSQQVLTELRQAIQPESQQYRQRFTVKMRQGIYLLNVEDIAYLQAQQGILMAFDQKGQRFPLNGQLAEMELQLDPKLFFRINRSEIIHVRYIDHLESYFNDRLAVRMKNKAEPLIASTGRTPDLRKWLEGE